ncbi:uncharacterized protein FTJAE_9216 [Fusarium tjaetaba]|uniref:Uncharacterized protein n=1 Tax=Fusarium tjaetaba TaxID=1567544 RepID=A0A8H5R8W0_9HYPO|nr:uncharacterized protein FTJAE_9216 [Fusarium tjaetaba]KAF5627546.1 hypothetical protein FTJAE_9216 [Fusarium tjaetaba]
MRTLNTINSSSSRPTSPGLSVSQPHIRRSASSAGNNKLVTSSKPLPKTRSKTPIPGQAQVQTKAQARPRFSSAGTTISSSARTTPSLGFHDTKQQHVLSVTATIPSTRSTSSSSAPPTLKMAPSPSDTRHKPPQLSAAAAKTVGRTPLTPKIASTAKGPLLGAPPLVRRSTQGLSSGTTGRDDAVTPRSGSRQGRNNSNSSTPNGTPNLDRDGWDPRASLGSSGRQSLSRAESPADPDAKFFRASDVPTSTQAAGRPSLGSQKPASYFHASKANAEYKKPTSPPVSAPFTQALSTAPEVSSSKFFYANGADLELQPSSANSSTTRLQSKRPSTSSSSNEQSYHALPPRPHSPIKIAQPTPSILKNTGAPGLGNRPQVASPPQIASPLAPPASITSSKRRVSIDAAPKKQRGHARAGSVPNFDHSHSPRLPMSPARRPFEYGSPPSSPGSAQPALTMASILQVAEDLDDEEEEEEGETKKEDGSQPDLQSPTKSSHEPVNELVANARRERKVQDLEITNASLEAINRTLERQLRKQQAEIRRYRRLSRSGRLSAVASAASSRVTSAALTDAPISLSDLSEEDNSEAPSDEEHDSLDESDLSMTDSVSASDPLDPTDEKAIEKAMSRRKRDEDRLQLDLTKHRELLVDSQKINQSIKRCLNWTEVLIKEGQKALEYKVRVTDVEFGGHILAPAIGDEDEDEDDTLASVDDLGTDPGSAALEAPPPWEKGSQDRDSGIELQPDSN